MEMDDVFDVNEVVESKSLVLGQMVEMEHEQIVFCNDNATGLKAIIAIHNTVLGPSLGGTRMWNYSNEADALKDVLRLSRGMTFKAAISGLNLGGGKAVIIGDSYTQKSEALFRRFGKFVNSLGGKYITAEDVGISPRDMEYVKMETDHVSGLPQSMGGSGDPSPVTAYGVYMGMKACAKFKWGQDKLTGKRIVVQGVGHVGEHLVQYLSKEGAKVSISDINEERLKRVAKENNATIIDGEDIFDVPMDIYAPCALGATVNSESIQKLTCEIIAGAANNQLENENLHGQQLMEKDIVYAPDFLINAGGLINVNSEVNGLSRERSMEMTEKIYDSTLDILKFSKKKGVATSDAAMKIAQNRIESIGKVKLGK